MTTTQTVSESKQLSARERAREKGVAPNLAYGTGRLFVFVREAEKAAISAALEKHGHNRTHTAEALGISRRTLLIKIKFYELQPRASVRAAARETLDTIAARILGFELHRQELDAESEPAT